MEKKGKEILFFDVMCGSCVGSALEPLVTW